MTSESSSAVLELNDADDTEASTVTDDPGEDTPMMMESEHGAPLMMDPGYDIAVMVDSPIKQLSTLETFVSYRVRCACARWPAPAHVRRRYNHFKLLHKRLAQSHPLIAPPPLPPLHSARQQLDRYSPSFVAVRTMALNAFLERVAKHPILTHSADLRIFLTTPDDEFDKVFKSDSSALNLWGLSTALYGSGEAKTATGARVKDPEFTSAMDYLHSLQHKLTALCALTTKLHKGTAALGAEMMGMKRVCDAWACQAGGRTARGAAAAAAGACAAAAAHSAAAAAAARGRNAHKAVLPLLAAYAAAHVDKIKQRDALHASYVSGANTTDDIHNRLEQASEALRSELLDWTPKTHADIKSLLLDLADKQVNLHSQALLGWEHALKLSTESNIDEIFKTVSKTAVQNLSPSRCRSVNETDRDIDEFSDIDVSNDFESIDVSGTDRLRNGDIKTAIHELSARKNDDSMRNVEAFDSDSVNNEENNSKSAPDFNKSDLNEMSDQQLEDDEFNNTIPSKELANNSSIDNIEDLSNAEESKDLENSSKDNSIDGVLNINSEIQGDTEKVHNIQGVSTDDFLKEILQDGPSSETQTKSDVIQDPLRSFSDVDLS